MDIKGLIESVPYVLAALFLAVLYNVVFDNPRVATRAREGYVAQSELIALQAQKDEADRQKKQAEDTIAKFQAAAAESEKEHEKEKSILEGRIAAYGAVRSSEGRKWDLTARDIDELRNNAAPQ